MNRIPAASTVISSTIAETGRLHAWLDEVFARHGVPDRVAHAVRLCLEEAVMNVILHGYGPGQPGAIEIALWSDGDEVLARVTDRAAPFDPTQPRPSGPRRADLADGPIGGRGLGLIRRYASRTGYARHGDGRNELTLGFAAA